MKKVHRDDKSSLLFTLYKVCFPFKEHSPLGPSPPHHIAPASCRPYRVHILFLFFFNLATKPKACSRGRDQLPHFRLSATTNLISGNCYFFLQNLSSHQDSKSQRYKYFHWSKQSISLGRVSPPPNSFEALKLFAKVKELLVAKD